MANFNYDAAQNIVQSIPASSTGFTEGAVTSPLTNAAINGFVDPNGAPNAFTSTGGPKTAAFSVQVTNGSGQVCAVISNPS